uniref:Uncharacterized protein n=1 Tax=Solanum lycopersicum TaxID=4081 RepID=A0A3Q7G880_SOLLC
MASSATVANGEFEAKSIRIVDLRLLSQSELYFLSLCSITDYNSCRDDEFIIPKIDRSVFNEFVASPKRNHFCIPYASRAFSFSRNRNRIDNSKSGNVSSIRQKKKRARRIRMTWQIRH